LAVILVKRRTTFPTALLRVLTRVCGTIEAVIGIVIVLVIHLLATPSIKQTTPSNPLVEPLCFHTLLFHLTGKLGEPERLDEVLGEGLAFLGREVDTAHHPIHILADALEEFRRGDETFLRHLGQFHLLSAVGVGETLQKLVDVVYGGFDVLQCLGIRIGRRRHTNDER
jgi:hypothetical protein